MHLIVGGAYQGKTEYAKEQYGVCEEEMLDGKDMDYLNLCKVTSSKEHDSGERIEKEKLCICNYHLLIRRMMEDGEDVAGFTKRLLYSHPDLVIILDEIGSGIVPLDKNERRWREQVGRTGCYLAANAQTVERLSCGIPMRLK